MITKFKEDTFHELTWKLDNWVEENRIYDYKWVTIVIDKIEEGWTCIAVRLNKADIEEQSIEQ